MRVIHIKVIKLSRERESPVSKDPRAEPKERNILRYRSTKGNSKKKKIKAENQQSRLLRFLAALKFSSPLDGNNCTHGLATGSSFAKGAVSCFLIFSVVRLRFLSWQQSAPGAYVVRQQFVPLVFSLMVKQLAEVHCSRHSPAAAGLLVLQHHVVGEFVFLFAVEFGS